LRLTVASHDHHGYSMTRRYLELPIFPQSRLTDIRRPSCRQGLSNPSRRTLWAKEILVANRAQPNRSYCQLPDSTVAQLQRFATKLNNATYAADSVPTARHIDSRTAVLRITLRLVTWETEASALIYLAVRRIDAWVSLRRTTATCLVPTYPPVVSSCRKFGGVNMNYWVGATSGSLSLKATIITSVYVAPSLPHIALLHFIAAS